MPTKYVGAIITPLILLVLGLVTSKTTAQECLLNADQDYPFKCNTSFVEAVRTLELFCELDTNAGESEKCYELAKDFDYCRVNITSKGTPEYGGISFPTVPPKPTCGRKDISFSIRLLDLQPGDAEKGKQNLQIFFNLASMMIDSLTIGSSNLTSRLMVGISKSDLRTAKVLNLQNNAMSDPVNPLIFSSNAFPKALQLVIESSNFVSFKQRAFHITRSIDLSIHNSNLGKVEPGAFTIKKDDCNSTLIGLSLQNVTWSIEGDPFLLETEGNCTTKSLVINLEYINSKQERIIQANIFENLTQAIASKSHTTLNIKHDNIDCCDSYNWWLFDKAGSGNSRITYEFRCLDLDDSAANAYRGNLTKLKEICKIHSTPILTISLIIIATLASLFTAFGCICYFCIIPRFQDSVIMINTGRSSKLKGSSATDHIELTSTQTDVSNQVGPLLSTAPKLAPPKLDFSLPKTVDELNKTRRISSPNEPMPRNRIRSLTTPTRGVASAKGVASPKDSQSPNRTSRSRHRVRKRSSHSGRESSRKMLDLKLPKHVVKLPGFRTPRTLSSDDKKRSSRVKTHKEGKKGQTKVGDTQAIDQSRTRDQGVKDQSRTKDQDAGTQSVTKEQETKPIEPQQQETTKQDSKKEEPKKVESKKEEPKRENSQKDSKTKTKSLDEPKDKSDRFSTALGTIN